MATFYPSRPRFARCEQVCREPVRRGDRARLAALARRFASLDDIFVAPAWPGVSDGPTDGEFFHQFTQRVHAWGADVALQLNGGGENSNRLLLLLGARFMAGTRHPSAPDLDVIAPHARTKMARLGHLDVLAAFGIYPGSLDLDFPLPGIRRPRVGRGPGRPSVGRRS